MESLPLYVPAVFVLTTVLTGWIFYRATNYSRQVLLLLPAWLAVTAVIAATGFFTVTNTLPPRFLVLVGPPMLLILGIFLTGRGKQFLDKLNLKALSILHVVRVPVEMVLFWLFLHKAVPDLMTFEGRNFDILSGLTAPVIYYFGFVKKTLNPKVILAWNFVCLGLLFNIVLNAMLAAPTPFQQFAFNQPNIAVLYFPFVWLPGFVVPLVLFSHLAAIRQLVSALSRHKPVTAVV